MDVLILKIGDFLLDTNIVIALGKGELDLQKMRQSNFFVANITIAELYYGAYKSQNRAKNIQKLQEFVASNAIIFADIQTSSYYGKISAELRTIGKPIPSNDIWIAALALQYGLVLVTRDQHFHHIDTLQLTRW